jgi:coenzyme PQQ precursor peptide PqqA
VVTLVTRPGTVPVTEQDGAYILCSFQEHEEDKMEWTTPTLVEICIGLEINGYLPAEF